MYRDRNRNGEREGKNDGNRKWKRHAKEIVRKGGKIGNKYTYVF